MRMKGGRLDGGDTSDPAHAADAVAAAVSAFGGVDVVALPALRDDHLVREYGTLVPAGTQPRIHPSLNVRRGLIGGARGIRARG